MTTSHNFFGQLFGQTAIKQSLRLIWAVLAIMATQSLFSFANAQTAAAPASAPNKTAHEVAEVVKNELVAVIRSKSELEAEGGEEKYFKAIEGVLLPVVDFKYIARGVMGQYGKQATPEQKKRFTNNFQKGLVTTYAKGLAGYGNHDISVVPAKPEDAGKKSQSVVLRVKGGDSVNVLAFTMKLNRSNEWKLTNMILNGINLGKTFRNQFAQSMKKNNDLDAVIDGWSN